MRGCKDRMTTSVKIPLSCVIVLSFLLFNFKTMVTWWDWPTPFSDDFHVSRFIFLLSRSWFLSSSQQSTIHLLWIEWIVIDSLYWIGTRDRHMNGYVPVTGICTGTSPWPAYARACGTHVLHEGLMQSVKWSWVIHIFSLRVIEIYTFTISRHTNKDVS